MSLCDPTRWIRKSSFHFMQNLNLQCLPRCNLTLEISKLPTWLNSQFLAGWPLQEWMVCSSSGVHPAWGALSERTCKAWPSRKTNKNGEEGYVCGIAWAHAWDTRQQAYDPLFPGLEQGFEPQHLPSWESTRVAFLFCVFTLPNWFLEQVCPSKHESRSLVINV